MKRGLSIYAFILSGILLLIPRALAYTDPRYFTESMIRGIVDFGTPVFSALFGMYSSDEFLFVKFLLFLLLFIMVKTGVKATPRLGENNTIANVVAMVVSLIAVRFISDSDLIQGILLPYGVLGVALTTILPFIIYFFFVEKWMASAGGRKIAWFFFTMIMVIIWVSRSDQIGETANYIYFGIIALGIFLFFFDKHVKKYFDRQANNTVLIGLLSARRNAKVVDYQNAVAANDKASIKRLTKEIKDLEDQIHSLS